MRFNFKDSFHDKQHDFMQCEEIQKLEFAFESIKIYF